MDNSYYTLTPAQLQAFEEKGYLVIPGFLSGPEPQRLQKWAQEVHDLPREGDVPYMPYEVTSFSNLHNNRADAGKRK